MKKIISLFIGLCFVFFPERVFAPPHRLTFSEEAMVWKGKTLVIKPSGGKVISKALETQDIVLGGDDRMSDLRSQSPVLYVRKGVDIFWNTAHHLALESFGAIVFEEGVRIANRGGAHFSVRADKGHQKLGSVHFLGDGPILEFGPSSQISFYGNGGNTRPWKSYRIPRSLFTFYRYIHDAQDLDIMRRNPGESYLLVRDIDLKPKGSEDRPAFKLIGTATHPFTGTLEGNGHTIRGLRQHYKGNVTRKTATGLFGFVDKANFANINIDNAQIQIVTNPSRSPDYGSFFIAHAKDTHLHKIALRRSKFYGSITHFGGLIGYGERCLFHQCKTDGPDYDVNFPTDIKKLEEYGKQWVVMARSKGNHFKLGGLLGGGKNCRFLENDIKGLVLWEDPLPFGTRGYRNQYIQIGKLLAPSVAHQDELRMWPAISQGVPENRRDDFPDLLDWAKDLRKAMGGMVGELENGYFKDNRVSNVKYHLDMLTAVGGHIGRTRNFVKIKDAIVSRLLVHNPQLMLLGAFIGFSEPNTEQNSDDDTSVFRDSHRIKRSNSSHITTDDLYFNQTTVRFADGRVMPLYPIGDVGFSRLIDPSQYQSLITYERTERDRQTQISTQTESARQTQLILSSHITRLDHANSQLNSSLASLAVDSKRLDKRRSRFFSGISKEGPFRIAVEHNRKRVAGWTTQKDSYTTTVNQWTQSLQNIKNRLAGLNNGIVPVESLVYLTTPLSQVEVLDIHIPSIRARRNQWIKPVLGAAVVVVGLCTLQPQLAAMGITLTIKVGLVTAGGIAGLTFQPGQSANTFVLPTAQEIRQLPTGRLLDSNTQLIRQGQSEFGTGLGQPTLTLSLLDSHTTSPTPSDLELSTSTRGRYGPLALTDGHHTDREEDQYSPFQLDDDNIAMDANHLRTPHVLATHQYLSIPRSVRFSPLMPLSQNFGITLKLNEQGEGCITFDYNHGHLGLPAVQLLMQQYLDNRSTSPERLKDTFFEESTGWATSKIEGWYDAQERLSINTIKEHLLPALAAYGVDGFILVNDSLDFVTVGGWSRLTGLMDEGAQIVRTKITQGTRDLTGNQRVSQNLGDYVYVVLSLGGGKGISTIKSLGHLKLNNRPHMGKDRPTSRALLSGEGKVDSFGKLDKIRKKGDNLTPHHMPQASYMKAHGVKASEGISMMMEQPTPGVGGRHRMTRTYGRKPDLTETPRQALGRDIKDVRRIYQRDGLHTPGIRKSLQEVTKANKAKFPDLFKKGE